MFALIQKKGLGFYLSFLAAVCASVSILAYRSASGDMYGYDSRVGYLFIAAIVVGLLFTYKDFFKIGPIVTGVFYCGALGLLINVRFVYFATVITGIAQEGVSTPMTVATMAIVSGIVLNLISAFFRNER